MRCMASCQSEAETGCRGGGFPVSSPHLLKHVQQRKGSDATGLGMFSAFAPVRSATGAVLPMIIAGLDGDRWGVCRQDASFSVPMNWLRA